MNGPDTLYTLFINDIPVWARLALLLGISLAGTLVVIFLEDLLRHR